MCQPLCLEAWGEYKFGIKRFGPSFFFRRKCSVLIVLTLYTPAYVGSTREQSRQIFGSRTFAPKFSWPFYWVITTKSTYTQCMKKMTSSSKYMDSIPSKVFKAIWQLKNLPSRVIIFVWRCLHNAIVVKGILAKFIISIDPLCLLCGKEIEIVDHLFFNCEFSQLIWFGSPLGLKTRGNNISFKDWIGYWFTLLLDTYALSLRILLIWHI